MSTCLSSGECFRVRSKGYGHNEAASYSGAAKHRATQAHTCCDSQTATSFLVSTGGGTKCCSLMFCSLASVTEGYRGIQQEQVAQKG